jgi:cytochrome oxidase Cu insertion factor (SCO1/SenC/PrrC family)
VQQSATILFTGLLSACWPAHAGPVDAPAVRPLQQFRPPAAGSYSLPVIQGSPDGTVLDIDGKAYPLRRYTTGKVTLLSFVYTYCVDPVGCPLAFDTFHELRRRLLKQPALARQVRLVSLSFDPTNDTPSAMRAYGGALADAASPLRWHFLTTRSVAELKPIIDDFGQDVAVTLDEQGRPTRLFNHLLKIFLIDAAGQVREIYTTAYLMPDVLMNDVETVLRAGSVHPLRR